MDPFTSPITHTYITWYIISSNAATLLAQLHPQDEGTRFFENTDNHLPFNRA
jgi:hypothetical protein